MEVKYDDSQDLTLILTQEEKRLLLGKRTADFWENPLIGSSNILKARVYLANSYDSYGVLCSMNARDLDARIGAIVIPDSENKGYPWLINLSKKGAKHLEEGWEPSIRYNGSNKLFIKVTNFQK